MNLPQIQSSCALLLLLLALLSYASCAQERKNDLIVKRDSTKTLCKVLVVNDQTIQYKKANDPDGPLFNILKSDVARIVYGNGETEVFAAPVGIAVQGNQEAVILYPTAPWRAPGFMDNLSLWRPDELKTASDFYKSSASKAKKVSIVFASVGAAASIAGIIWTSTQKRKNYYYYSSDPLESGVGLIIAGVSVGTIGVLISHTKASRHKRNARKVDEELTKRKISFGQLRILPSMNPLHRSASVSLALQF